MSALITGVVIATLDLNLTSAASLQGYIKLSSTL